MMRLSRPIIGLFALAALLSVANLWEGCADGERTAPLTAVGEWAEARAGTKQSNWDAEVKTRRAATERLEKLTLDVADGRVSLVDGAARLREEFLAKRTFPWKRFRETTPGDTDEERFCRNLIDRIALRLRDEPERVRAVVAHLEAELAIYREKVRSTAPSAKCPLSCTWRGGTESLL